MASASSRSTCCAAAHGGEEPGEPGGAPRGIRGLGQEAPVVSESIITVRDWMGPSDVRESAAPRKRTFASERVRIR